MSYRVKYKGFEELEKKLERVADKSVNICKGMVYSGADVCADAIKSSLQANVSGKATGELANSLNIKPMSVQGTKVSTKIHFAGYNSHPSPKYASGQPNAIIAAVLESGRSDQPNRRATHFFSSAMNSSKGEAIQAMSDKLDKMIDAIISGE